MIKLQKLLVEENGSLSKLSIPKKKEIFVKIFTFIKIDFIINIIHV